MKIVVDTYFQTPDGRKRTPVPLGFIDIANAIIRSLHEKLRTYGLEGYVELIRARFEGGVVGGFIEVTGITSIRLFDLHADSRFEHEIKCGVDNNTVAQEVAGEHAQDLYRKLWGSIDSVLTTCKRRKIRFEVAGKVVEPVD